LKKKGLGFMAEILMIIGSQREGSFNRKFAEEAEKIIGDRASVHYLDYTALPYFCEDLEYPAPKEVETLRKQVRQADGLWIFTPEYNHQIPGVLKNLLDWLSRPLKQNDWSGGSWVSGKYVTISGVAGKSASVNARYALYSLLEFIQLQVIGEAGCGVALDFSTLSPDQPLFPDWKKEELRKQVELFLQNISPESYQKI